MLLREAQDIPGTSWTDFQVAFLHSTCVTRDTWGAIILKWIKSNFSSLIQVFALQILSIIFCSTLSHVKLLKFPSSALVSEAHTSFDILDQQSPHQFEPLLFKSGKFSQRKILFHTVGTQTHAAAEVGKARNKVWLNVGALENVLTPTQSK